MDKRLISEIEGTNSGIQLLLLKPRILDALKAKEILEIDKKLYRRGN